MSEAPEHLCGGSPAGLFLEAGADSASLVCKEVWGGNRNFFGPIELPGLRGVLFSQPCQGARGGDVHYLSVCGSGLISRACLADVTGHGESVAAVSQTMHELLRQSVDRRDERKVLRRLNLRLVALDQESFTTAAVLTYFPPTRRLSISCAGHEPPWYCDAESRHWAPLEPVPQTGLVDIPLGVDPNTRYTHHVQRVALGDRLLMITDGVLEAPGTAGDQFGRQRLAEVTRSTCDREPQEQVMAIIAALRAHMNGLPLAHDDVSILLIQFVNNLGSSALWTALRNRLFPRRRRDGAAQTASPKAEKAARTAPP